KPGISLGFYQNDVIVPVDNLLNKWHHVAISWEGDRTVLVAVDGKLASGSTWQDGLEKFDKKAVLKSAPSPKNNGSTVVGTSRRFGAPGFKSFRGLIDELAVWDRALGEDELLSLAGYAAKKKSYCEE